MTNQIEKFLDKLYPNPKCELDFQNEFQLLIAVVLSAQCTDKRVNQVTKVLFDKYKTSQELANAKTSDVEKIIYSLGFYKNKSKNIISLAKDITEKHNGKVPNDFEMLTNLSGVGRKTANVVMSTAFHQNAIAVDTHVFRVSKRLGLTKSNSTLGCEMDLRKTFSPDTWSKRHHQMVLFGRYFCKAQKPNCENCELKNICKKGR